MAEVRGNPLADDGREMFCRECTWYRGTPLTGVCYGAPPTAVLLGARQNLVGKVEPALGSYWPQVDGNKFCGHFKADRDKELDPVSMPIPAGLILPNAAMGNA